MHGCRSDAAYTHSEHSSIRRGTPSIAPAAEERLQRSPHRAAQCDAGGHRSEHCEPPAQDGPRLYPQLPPAHMSQIPQNNTSGVSICSRWRAEATNRSRQNLEIQGYSNFESIIWARLCSAALGRSTSQAWKLHERQLMSILARSLGCTLKLPLMQLPEQAISKSATLPGGFLSQVTLPHVTRCLSMTVFLQSHWEISQARIHAGRWAGS